MLVLKIMKKLFVTVTLFLAVQLSAEIKNIVWDLGGVILPGGPRYYVQEKIPEKKDLLDMVKTDAWQKWDEGRITKEDLQATLAAQYDADDIRRLIAYTLNVAERSFDDHILSLIEDLKRRGYKLYLLSNFSKDAHAQFIQGNKRFDVFDGLMFSHEVACSKPGEKIYRDFLSRFDLNPEESLFIDDSEKNIDGARAVGFKGITYHNEEQLRLELDAFLN